jgi:hypothetical protein
VLTICRLTIQSAMHKHVIIDKLILLEFFVVTRINHSMKHKFWNYVLEKTFNCLLTASTVINLFSYKVAVHLYKKQKNYSKIIECHLKDNTLKSKVFTYINELYNQNIQEMKSAQNVNQGIYQEVRAAIMSHLLDLV